MPTLVPTHTVILKRDHPKGEKDKDGNVRQVSVSPKIGEPFDFSDEEADHVLSHRDTGLRQPVNESKGDQSAALRDDVESEAKAGADRASQNNSAPNDAAVTARSGALLRGSAKKTARDPEVLRENVGQQDEDEEL